MTFGAVVYAKNVALVSAFYGAVLGAATTVARGYATVDAPGFQLVVVEVPEALAATIHVTVPPERRQDTPVKITLPVADIALTREVAQQLGGVVDPVDRQWRFHGTSVCDGHDPEGNVFQLRQARS
jgi:predicted enzyme related to lactoylglutathione lyase